MKITKLFSLLSWIVFLLFTAFSKANTIDSLQALTSETKAEISSRNYKTAIQKSHKLLSLLSVLPDTVSLKKEDVYLDMLALSHVRSKQLDSAEFYTNKAFKIFQEKYGDDHARIADCYHQWGRIYNAARQYEKSIEIKKKSLALREKLFGEYSEEAVVGLYTMAVTYMIMGDYSACIETYKKAIDVLLQVRDSADSQVALYMSQVSIAYNHRGNYEEAIKWDKKALTIRKRIFGENSLEVAGSLASIGTNYYFLGELEKSLKLQLQALAIAENLLPENHVRLKTYYHNIANLYSDINDLLQAVFYFNKAEKAYAVNGRKKERGLVALYNDFSRTYHDMGDKKKSFEYAERAFEIGTEILSPHSMHYNVLVNNMGLECAQIADYENALVYYEQVLKNSEKLKNDPLLGRTMMNMGDAYLKLKNYQDANMFFEKSIALFEERFPNGHEFLADAYANYGNGLYEQSQLKRAIYYLEKSIAVNNKVFGAFHENNFSNYNALVKIFAETGEWNLAQEHWENAARVIENIKGKSQNEIQLYYSAGYLTFLKKDYDRALNYLEKAIDVSDYKNGMAHVYDFSVLSSSFELKGEILWELYRQKNDFRNKQIIFENYEQATELVNFQKNKISSSSKLELINRSTPLFEAGIKSCFLYGENIPEPVFEKAFNYAESTKALMLSYALQMAKVEFYAGVPDSLIEKEHTLSMQIAYLEKKQYQASGNSSRDSIWKEDKENISGLKLELLNLHKELEKNYPDYFQLKKGAQKITLTSIQKMLNPEQSLVEYFLGDNSIYVFVIQKNNFALKEIPLDFPLAEWISQLNNSIYKNGIVSSKRPVAGEKGSTPDLLVANACLLYEKIVKPLGALNRELIIVPDGVLGYLPFEVLLKNKPESLGTYNSYQWLGMEHIISYNYSASLWQEMINKKTGGKGLLAFAPSFNRNYDLIVDAADYRRSNLGPLAHNIPEVKNIINNVGGEMLTGTAATAEAFLDLAERNAVLHLATHAKLDDRNSDYSYLAFSGVNDSTDAGKVYIRDLYNMRLPLDMVVLSACETGIGKLQKGEGIISLARGFTYAGAKSIITSLWEVNDRSTKEIMTYFYDELKNGKSKSEALKNAKLNYLQNVPENKYAHPFYWASFVAVGDMAPLDFNSGFNWWILLFGFLLILGVLILKFTSQKIKK